MKKFIALVLMGMVLTGCNTMEGFGKDVKKVGDKVEGAAKK